MARLYSNENFPLPVVVALRALGHDVVTTIVCTLNTNFPAQAAKIDAMLKSIDSLAGQLIRVNRGD